MMVLLGAATAVVFVLTYLSAGEAEEDRVCFFPIVLGSVVDEFLILLLLVGGFFLLGLPLDSTTRRSIILSFNLFQSSPLVVVLLLLPIVRWVTASILLRKGDT